MRPYYEDGTITIYHGDSREIVHYLDSFDLLLTDPPYGIGFAKQPTRGQRLAGMKPKEWDDSVIGIDFINIAISKAVKSVIWGGNYYHLPASRCVLSWFKPDSPPSMGNVEYAWTNLDQNSRAISHSISATNKERLGHPTQKPLRVMSFSLKQAGVIASVLDPFMGSGTVARACKDNGIKCVSIDLDERYCEMSAIRMSQSILDLK